MYFLCPKGVDSIDDIYPRFLSLAIVHHRLLSVSRLDRLPSTVCAATNRVKACVERRLGEAALAARHNHQEQRT